MNIDDLELELRRLPGVRAAGFLERDGVLLVQLQVGPGEVAPAAAFQATRIAYRHSERPVAVEVVRWRDVPAGVAAIAPAGPSPGSAAERAAAPSRAGGPGAPGFRHAGAEPGEAEPGGTEPGGTEPGGTEPGEAEPGGAEPGEGTPPHVFEGGTVGPAAEGDAAARGWVEAEVVADRPPTGGARGEDPGAGWVVVGGTEPGPTAGPGGVATGETLTEAVGEPPEAPDGDRPAPDLAPAPATGGPAWEAPERRGVEAISEPRVRLLAVLTFPDTDELEVHLTFGGRRSIGRADSGLGLLGAVEATIHALQVFVPSLGYTAAWARTLESTTGDAFLVACTVSGEEAGARHGLAAGSSAAEAAARATLHSLNRTLALQLPVAG